ncbi:MAG: hypothetical protein ACREVH_01110 [Gammaproteobacteria bacterium]
MPACDRLFVYGTLLMRYEVRPPLGRAGRFFGHDDRIWCWTYVYAGRMCGFKHIASGTYRQEPVGLDHAAAL